MLHYTKHCFQPRLYLNNTFSFYRNHPLKISKTHQQDYLSLTHIPLSSSLTQTQCIEQHNTLWP